MTSFTRVKVISRSEASPGSLGCAVEYSCGIRICWLCYLFRLNLDYRPSHYTGSERVMKSQRKESDSNPHISIWFLTCPPRRKCPSLEHKALKDEFPSVSFLDPLGQRCRMVARILYMNQEKKTLPNVRYRDAGSSLFCTQYNGLLLISIMIRIISNSSCLFSFWELYCYCISIGKKW